MQAGEDEKVLRLSEGREIFTGDWGCPGKVLMSDWFVIGFSAGYTMQSAGSCNKAGTTIYHATFSSLKSKKTLVPFFWSSVILPFN